MYPSSSVDSSSSRVDGARNRDGSPPAEIRVRVESLGVFCEIESEVGCVLSLVMGCDIDFEVFSWFSEVFSESFFNWGSEFDNFRLF